MNSTPSPCGNGLRRRTPSKLDPLQRRSSPGGWPRTRSSRRPRLYPGGAGVGLPLGRPGCGSAAGTTSSTSEATAGGRDAMRLSWPRHWRASRWTTVLGGGKGIVTKSWGRASPEAAGQQVAGALGWQFEPCGGAATQAEPGVEGGGGVCRDAEVGPGVPVWIPADSRRDLILVVARPDGWPGR